MRIDSIGGGNQYYNYAPKVEALNKARNHEQLGHKDTMSLLLKATPCSTRGEAIVESQKHPGQIFSWGSALYRNGKRIN